MKGFRFVAAFIALALAACGDGSVQSPAFTEALIKIEVLPNSPTTTVPAGRTVEFTAIGTFTTSPGSPSTTRTGPVTGVNWAVADSAVASIDSSSGLATGKAIGSTVVTASAKGVTSEPAPLNVTAAVLDSIVIVDPDDETQTPITSDGLALGETARYQALGVFSDSETPRPISDVLWASSAPLVASVTPAGSTTTAVALSVGSTEISATSTGTPGVTGTLALAVGAAEVSSLLRVEPPFAVVIPENSVAFVAIGEFSDGSEGPVSDASIDWTSSVPAVATIDAEGNATGVAEGQTVITATLKPDAGDAEGQRSATADLTVANTACTSPLLNSQGASITSEVNDLCLLCSVTDTANMIDDSFSSFGLVSVPVGLLNGSASVTVKGGSSMIPFAAGGNPGFILGRPAGTLVLAEVLSQVEIATVLNGAVQETSGPIIPLRLDLLGLELVQNSDTVLASVTNTTLAYDSVRLKLKSGVASALTNMQVYSACFDTSAPDTVPGLVRVLTVEPNNDTGEVEQDSSLAFQLMGEFADGSIRPIPNSAVTWSSSNTAIATINANGLVTGVAPGSATLTARLNDSVDPAVTQRQATGTVTVLAKVCTTPMLASAGAVVDHFNDIGCLVCSVTDEANVIDAPTNNFATMKANLSLLAGTSLVVSSAETPPEAAPFPAGQRAGFVIGRPVGDVLSLDLLGGIEVALLRNGTVVSSSSPTIPLKLDLLGVNLTANSETGLVSVLATAPYDALRIRLGGAASVLSSVQVFRACSAAATLP